MEENEARQPRPRRPNGSKAYPAHSVRISNAVWAKAKARAARDGVTVSRVASLLIEGYADRALNLPVTAVNYDRTPRAPTKAEELLARLNPWSLDELRQIIDTATTYKTMARWARAMDVASDHPEEFLSTAQMAGESGMSINEWRDAPRKLPQHLVAHFPANIEWPLAAVGGRELGKEDQVYWGITIEQTQRWKQVRAEAAANES